MRLYRTPVGVRCAGPRYTFAPFSCTLSTKVRRGFHAALEKTYDFDNRSITPGMFLLVPGSKRGHKSLGNQRGTAVGLLSYPKTYPRELPGVSIVDTECAGVGVSFPRRYTVNQLDSE